jgi:hypothetical protein
MTKAGNFLDRGQDRLYGADAQRLGEEGADRQQRALAMSPSG